MNRRELLIALAAGAAGAAAVKLSARPAPMLPQLGDTRRVGVMPELAAPCTAQPRLPVSIRISAKYIELVAREASKQVARTVERDMLRAMYGV